MYLKVVVWLVLVSGSGGPFEWWGGNIEWQLEPLSDCIWGLSWQRLATGRA